VVESIVFTFYFLNIARVIASWMLSTQISNLRDSNVLESSKQPLNIKQDFSDELIREVTGVNQMIRYVMFAYVGVGIPMLISNAILWQKATMLKPQDDLPTTMLVNLGVWTVLFICI